MGWLRRGRVTSTTVTQEALHSVVTVDLVKAPNVCGLALASATTGPRRSIDLTAGGGMISLGCDGERVVDHQPVHSALPAGADTMSHHV